MPTTNLGPTDIYTAQRSLRQSVKTLPEFRAFKKKQNSLFVPPVSLPLQAGSNSTLHPIDLQNLIQSRERLTHCHSALMYDDPPVKVKNMSTENFLVSEVCV